MVSDKPILEKSALPSTIRGINTTELGLFVDIESICSEFAELDAEVKQEFYADVKDCVADINECAAIVASEDTQVLVNRLFRSIHTIKGNCNMVFLPPFVEATHVIEELVQDVRNGKYPYHPAYGKLLITAINAIDELLGITMQNSTIDTDSLAKLERLMLMVKESDGESRVEQAMRGELAILDKHYSLDLVAVSQFEGEAFSIFDATDMEFFHYLSECQRAIDPLHKLRMKIQVNLLLSLNSRLHHPEEEEQILAALYTYEFFRIVEGSGVDRTRRRVFSAGSLLARVSGWSRASEIVFQTNEKWSGEGFPRGLQGNQIIEAAKALSLADEFASNALQHQTEGYKKSLFIAVKLINQKADIEYPQELINHFNQVIKQDFLTQKQW